MGRERRHKNISMRILFSPLHRKMYISRRPLLYAAILSACINSKRVCRALHRSLMANARAQARPRCNNDKDDCCKKRTRASAQRVQLKMMAVLISEAHSATNKLHAAACIRIWMQMRERDLLVVCAICMRRFDDSSP
jgi:hypothetical protein